MDRRRFFMKDFKLVTEQVDLLKSRGMLFEDEQDAICKLLSDNYYNIINGYKDLFFYFLLCVHGIMTIYVLTNAFIVLHSFPSDSP